MGSRSDEALQADMNTLQSFCISNLVVLLFIVTEKTIKTKNLNIDWWNLKIRSVSNKTYQQDMQRYTLKSYNTPNVVVLMIKETEK